MKSLATSIGLRRLLAMICETYRRRLFNGEPDGVRCETVHVQGQRIGRGCRAGLQREIGDLQIHLIEALELALRSRVFGVKV